MHKNHGFFSLCFCFSPLNGEVMTAKQGEVMRNMEELEKIFFAVAG